jgi:hypothetical protein
MPAGKEKNVCLDDGVLYSEGSEYCLDVYCFKCVDGEWETHASIGVPMDLSRVV